MNYWQLRKPATVNGLEIALPSSKLNGQGMR